MVGPMYFRWVFEMSAMYRRPNAFLHATRLASDSSTLPSAAMRTPTLDRNTRCLSSAPRMTSAQRPSAETDCERTGNRPSNKRSPRGPSSDETGQPKDEVRSLSGLTRAFRSAIKLETPLGLFSRKPASKAANQSAADADETCPGWTTTEKRSW